MDFYGQGTKMIVNDVQYAWSLLFKAVQGFTLKPREVNSIRRIAKDLLTLIPFTIILIVPLTPIGHVLVFSFIQVTLMNASSFTIFNLCYFYLNAFYRNHTQPHTFTYYTHTMC
jgi:LETM1-like protein